MTPELDLPIGNAYWVDEGKIMAGEYPGAYDPAVSSARIRGLLQHGVRTWLDLTRDGDSSHPYEELLAAEAADFGVQVSRMNFPVSDFSNPSKKVMTEILDFIDQEISADRCIYVHCLAGIGRTGTTVGCYLVRHGMSGDEALARIVQLRENVTNWWHKSPETGEQMDFIRNWQPGT